MKKLIIVILLIVSISALMLYAGFKDQQNQDQPGNHLKSSKGTIPM